MDNLKSVIDKLGELQVVKRTLDKEIVQAKKDIKSLVEMSGDKYLQDEPCKKCSATGKFESRVCTSCDGTGVRHIYVLPETQQYSVKVYTMSRHFANEKKARELLHSSTFKAIFKLSTFDKVDVRKV